MCASAAVESNMKVEKTIDAMHLYRVEVVSASHIIADLTLSLGKVIHDYLA